MYRELKQLVDVRGDVKRNGSFKKRSWSQITGISRHHSATTSGDAFSFANYHVDSLGWPSVGYHFVITRDGKIQWANSVNRISYNTGGHNTPLIGICLVGNGSFTDAQEESYFDLVQALRKTNGINVTISNLKGHNEYSGHAQNACPGIDMGAVRSAIRADHPMGQPVKGISTEDRESTDSLKRGDNGDDVKLLQEDLIALGFNLDKYGADGDFGGETEDAVKAFQLEHDLSSEKGNFFGVAGPSTMGMIEKLLTPEEEEITNKMAVVKTEVLNVRNRPSSSDNAIAGQVEEGEAFTVVKKVKANGHIDDMYKLKSGLYISAHEDYTELKDLPNKEPSDKMVLVSAEELNVRSEPSFEDDAIVGQVFKGEAFTIKDRVNVEDSESDLYELISGLFISTNPEYVEVRE